MNKNLLLTAILVLQFYLVTAQTKLTVKNASKHIGEIVSICDNVCDYKVINNSSVIILQVGCYAPNQYLTVLVKGIKRDKFEDFKRIYFKGTKICVNGRLIKYKGKPMLIANSQSSLKTDIIDNFVRAPVLINKPSF